MFVQSKFFYLRLAAQAIEAKADFFLTYNKKDIEFLASAIPALRPDEWLRSYIHIKK